MDRDSRVHSSPLVYFLHVILTLPFYMLLDRLAMWEWAQREKRIWWEERLTLREWVEPFTSPSHLL